MKLTRLETTGETPAPAVDRGDGAPDSVTTFSCSEGLDFQARFPGHATIQISIAEGKHTLQRERTASGARYLGNGIDFWNKGAEAILAPGGQRYQCLRTDPAE